MTLRTPHGREVTVTGSAMLGPTPVVPSVGPAKPIRFDLVTGGKHRVEGVPVQVAGRPNPLQFYQLRLHGKSLPLDLFPLRGHKGIRTADLSLDAWVMGGSHLLRIEHKALRACELLCPETAGLPDSGSVTQFFCAGEHEYEHTFERDGVNYMVTIQTESLSENLYADTYKELLDHAREVQGLTHLWRDEAGKCLSMLDLQRYARELHVHAYHMIGNGGLVIRTQTIFELVGHG